MTLRTIPVRWMFLLGMLVTLIPTFGPFAAIVLLFTQRLSFQRRDLLWAGAGLALALPALFRGAPVEALTAVGTVAGPWIVFRTFFALKHLGLAPGQRGQVAVGLLAGFSLAVATGLLRTIGAIDLDTSLTVPTAIDWERAPALFGHGVLVMGGLIAMLTRERRSVGITAMALAAFGILLSGSREAAIAWVILAVLLIAFRDADARRPRTAEIAVLVVMLLVAAGLAPLLGWGRVGFLLSPDGSGEPGRNLLTGTEVPEGDWWDNRWVRLDADDVLLGGRTLTAYEVRKTGSESWLRLQQLVRLTPGTTYTLSAWIEGSTDAVPGLHGWAQMPDRTSAFVLTSTLRNGTFSARVTGPGELLAAREIDREGAWRRLAVTFRYGEQAAPVTWFVGFAPDTRPMPGEATRMAGLQLEAAEDAGPYVPGSASGGLSFQVARAPLWHAAWMGIAQRPLVGHGTGAFPDYFLEAMPGQDRVQAVPAHPHNQLLLTLFEKGVVGFIGLSLLLVALFGLAVRYRDLGLLSVLVAVLIANTFDSTLLYGGVLYPLAAAAGWRSSRRGARRSTGADAARQATVRATLALADAGAVLLAFLASHATAHLLGLPAETPPLVGYAVLLWPAFAWREGLYPGYGLTPAQELKKQTTAAAYALLMFTAATLLFPDGLSTPLPAIALFGASTFLVTPSARAGTKRLLHAMRLWGRPVVIFGAGETGRRVVRSLKRTPLDGLHPIALFDDDPSLRTRRARGVRVRGELADAQAFAERHHVRHAIVAIPTLREDLLDDLISGSGRVFRTIQFVPKLGGLPSDGVVASDLDGMLALEVRNGLFSVRNRAVKRIVDVVGAAVGVILLGPVMAALWAWVRLDSPGGALHASQRVGQDGRTFPCLKFRTMHVDAEERLQWMLLEDPEIRAEYGRWHKLTNDPRVTHAGRFLRRTSLDELPQLFNVLRGEMSLVGPRPYLAREIPEMGGYTRILFQAKPGITGHWQIAARNTVTFEERLAIEAHYVRNWSIWWDITLLMHTPLALLRSRGKVA